MTPRYRILSIALPLVFFCLSGIAHGHKINVFAFEEEGTIFCESTFSGGRPAKNSAVTVVAASSQDTPLISGQTDETGKFSFQPTERMIQEELDVEIIVQSGDGHKNSWVLSASDYLGSAVTTENTSQNDSTDERSARPQEPGIKSILSGLAVIFAIALFITIFRSRKRGKHE